MVFSPRERGWPAKTAVEAAAAEVLPARAGVARGMSTGRPAHPRSPRASGGGPAWAINPIFRLLFSPRERGWPASGRCHGPH
mgnify:CR=1 FL=1